MHGKNAELHGHTGKEYWKSRLHRFGETPGKYTKYLTHKKERRESKQLIHNLIRHFDNLGSHLEYQFANKEAIWTKDMDLC